MDRRETHTVDATGGYRQIREALDALQQKRAEAALSEQVAFQNALLQVSRAVQQMTRPEHLEGVVVACREQLRVLDVSFVAIAVHRLLDPETQTFESYEVMPSGQINRLVRAVPNVYRLWQQQKTIYRGVDARGAEGHVCAVWRGNSLHSRHSTRTGHAGVVERCGFGVFRCRGPVFGTHW